MRTWITTLGAIALLLATPALCQAFVSVTTISGWNYSDTNVSPFGEPNTATYGQTFTVVAPDTQLDEFTFWLYHTPSSVDPINAVIDFETYVMAWDSPNQRAAGPILYSSGPRTTDSSSGFEQIDSLTGGLLLAAGQEYVAFMSASGHFDGIPGLASSWLNSNVYSGGAFAFNNNDDDFSKLTTESWLVWDHADLAFVAKFSAPADDPGTPPVVPEPSSMAVWALLGATMGVGARRAGKSRG